ncbi:hypothetical protein ABPG74_006789 [Tetrahymena malaccensis]
MNKKIISRKIQKTCPSFLNSQIFLLLDALEKNKPHFKIIEDEIQERILFDGQQKTNISNQYKFIQHMNKIQGKKLSCIQMRINDKKDKIKKWIEIFSYDQLQDTFDLIISYAQQSKLLSQKNVILNILDSYYLDEEMLFYLVEYEDFEFFCQNVNNIQYVNAELDLVEQSQFQQELLGNYLYEIYKYSIESLNPLSGYLQKSIFIQNGYFIFQKYQEQQLLVKLNTVDPYLFQDYSADISQPQQQICFQINLPIVQVQLNVQQQAFLSQIAEKYPKFLKNNQIILEKLVNSEEKYCLLKVNEQENCFLIKSIQNNQPEYIQVQKYSTQLEANSQIEKYNSLADQIKLTKFKANSYFFIDTNSQGSYLITKVDYLDKNSQNQNQQIVTNTLDNLQVLNAFPIDCFQNKIALDRYSKCCNTTFIKAINLVLQIVNSYKYLFQLNISPKEILVSQNQEILISESIFHFYFFTKKRSYSNLSQTYSSVLADLLAQFKLSFYRTYINDNKLEIQIKKKFQNYFDSLADNDNLDEQITYNSVKLFLLNLQEIYALNQKFLLQIFEITASNLDYLTCKVQIYFSNYEQLLQELSKNVNINTLIILQQPFQFFKKTLPFKLVIDIQNDAQQNLEAIEKFIDKILETFCNLNEKATRNIKDISLQLLHKYYDLDDLKIKYFNKDYTQNICSCQTNISYQEGLQNHLIDFINQSYTFIFYSSYQNKQNTIFCLSHQQNQLISQLAGKISGLQILDFPFQFCEYTKSLMEQDKDYFDLKNKQDLFKIVIRIQNQKCLSYFKKQLNQNKHRINTIEGIKFLYSTLNKNPIKKIYRLVQLF